MAISINNKGKETLLFKFLISFFSLFLSISCGIKGPPLQPVPKLLPQVENVKIYQKGKNLLVSISFPESYSDKTPLKIKKFRIHYNFYPLKKRVDLKKFLKESISEEINSPEDKNLIFKREIKSYSQDFKILFFYWDSAGKKSPPSKLFEFEVKEPPPRPENFNADVKEDGIHLRWKREKNIGFFVYFSTGKDFIRVNQEPLDKDEFIFKDFSWDLEYYFRVSSVSEKFYESEDSEEISITPVDRFPPPAPKNLIAIPEEGFILLKWERVEVEDLEKYNVYRKEDGKEEFLKLEGVKDTTFEDRKGEKGKVYKYFVTAVDKKGNESNPSNLVEERFR